MQSTLRRTLPASLDGGPPVHLVESWFRRSDPFGVELNYDHDDIGRPIGIRIERDDLDRVLGAPDGMVAIGTRALLSMTGDAALTLEFTAADGYHRIRFDAAMMRLFLEETDAVVSRSDVSAVIAAELDADLGGL